MTVFFVRIRLCSVSNDRCFFKTVKLARLIFFPGQKHARVTSNLDWHGNNMRKEYPPLLLPPLQTVLLQLIPKPLQVCFLFRYTFSLLPSSFTFSTVEGRGGGQIRCFDKQRRRRGYCSLLLFLLCTHKAASRLVRTLSAFEVEDFYMHQFRKRGTFSIKKENLENVIASPDLKPQQRPF